MAGVEVIHAATLQNARILGKDDEIGSIQVGKHADILLIKENPLSNLKVLYASGHIKLDDANTPIRAGGVDFVIKSGVVYSGDELRASIKEMVATEKNRLGIASGAMPIVGFSIDD